MLIHPAGQGSLEWLQARAGVVTASEFDQVVTPEFKARKSEMTKTYLAKKVAEKWTGSPMPSFQSLDMDFGKILEEEVLPWLEFTTGDHAELVGLITTDDGRVGCSPDGIIGQDVGLEVKCPEAHTHVRYLLDGTVPKQYLAQVHGGMYVTGFKQWRFVSYKRHFPALILTVERDEEIQEKLHEALEEFLAQMDHAMAKLERLNGGPSKRAQPPMSVQPQPTEEGEIIP